VRVQLRDTSLADAPAILLKEAHGAVARSGSNVLATVQLDVDTVPRGATVWVHVDVDGDGKVSAGDYVTTRSYPVLPGASTAINVEVQRV
jgi:uncharacterized lipoprotein YbaY